MEYEEDSCRRACFQKRMWSVVVMANTRRSAAGVSSMVENMIRNGWPAVLGRFIYYVAVGERGECNAPRRNVQPVVTLLWEAMLARAEMIAKATV